MIGKKTQHEASDLEARLAAAHQRIAQLEAALQSQTGRDPVTGLPDLRRLRTQLDIEMDRARRHGHPLSTAVLDLDGFRSINATEGLREGDRALEAAARLLESHTRSHDLVSRTGGDEFTIMMPETDTAGASQCLERVIDALQGTRVGRRSTLEASAGVATFKREQSAPDLLAAARRALDKARLLGGGRVATVGQMKQPEGAEEAAEGAEEPEESKRDAVEALAVTLLERDRYTGEHSESVVELAGGVARGLGLPDEEVQRVRAAALLHDIGKVAIPDDILQKPGELTEEQWKLMRDHPVIGERILRAIPGMGGVARIVRHEHESYDGSGYPDGLAGEEIPIGSRIILACDAYHAMVSDRPYRKAMNHGEAITELSRCAGKQFDPEITELLIGRLYAERQTAATGG